MKKLVPDNFAIKKEVDMVFLIDNQCLLNALAFASGKDVDTYKDPHHFLKNVSRYPKHTKIMLGQNFSNFDQKGIQIAEHLHGFGFTRLYLLSAQDFSGCQTPDYLTIIKKLDIDKIRSALNE